MAGAHWNACCSVSRLVRRSMDFHQAEWHTLLLSVPPVRRQTCGFPDRGARSHWPQRPAVAPCTPAARPSSDHTATSGGTRRRPKLQGAYTLRWHVPDKRVHLRRRKACSIAGTPAGTGAFAGCALYIPAVQKLARTYGQRAPSDLRGSELPPSTLPRHCVPTSSPMATGYAPVGAPKPNAS